MQIETTRFGAVSIQDCDVLTFSDGLIGMETCRRWALLADAQNSALGWLQSLDRAEVALAVVSPRRFVPDYRVRVSSRDLGPLGLPTSRSAQVLVIVSVVRDRLALNLKAPLVIHADKQTGRQIVAKDDHAVQYFLNATAGLRKSA